MRKMFKNIKKKSVEKIQTLYGVGIEGEKD
jgi:hypothetical protein